VSVSARIRALGSRLAGLAGLALLAAAGCAVPAATATDARPGPVGARAAPPRDVVMERFVDSVLAGLTLEEKLGQLNQPGTAGVNATGPEARTAGENEIRAGRVGSLLSVNGAELTRRLQRIAVEESRARIPLLFGNDVIHGHRTISPIPLAEAASWDPEAVEASARWAAFEATAFGINWTYAPMVDVARDPRWGRIMEGSGEDPYLGSVMAAARVRGFQGDDLAEPTTMLATAKHFVAYGAAEGGRDYNIADVSERTLREVYLPPFRAAIEAGAGSVMAAFNEVAGVPMHAHRPLIQELLRRDWGWEDGLLVSDYTGVTELIPHGVAVDSAAAAALALRAGVDVDMVSQAYLRTLAAQVASGAVPVSLVDESVRRVLRAKYRLGLFEDPYRYSDTTRQRQRTLSAPHVAAVR
jgi:beta-glucosidase